MFQVFWVHQLFDNIPNTAANKQHSVLNSHQTSTNNYPHHSLAKLMP